MRLEIYVASHCPSCREALRIAEQARRVPRLEVAVVNLDVASAPAPAGVVAVPTYVLDGRVISRGNPRATDFLARLARQTESEKP